MQERLCKFKILSSEFDFRVVRQNAECEQVEAVLVGCGPAGLVHSARETTVPERSLSQPHRSTVAGLECSGDFCKEMPLHLECQSTELLKLLRVSHDPPSKERPMFFVRRQSIISAREEQESFSSEYRVFNDNTTPGLAIDKSTEVSSKVPVKVAGTVHNMGVAASPLI